MKENAAIASAKRLESKMLLFFKSNSGSTCAGWLLFIYQPARPSAISSKRGASEDE
jgi:hypothetical protein